MEQTKLKAPQRCHKCQKELLVCIQVLLGWPDTPALRHYCPECYKEPLEPLMPGITRIER